MLIILSNISSVAGMFIFFIVTTFFSLLLFLFFPSLYSVLMGYKFEFLDVVTGLKSDFLDLSWVYNNFIGFC